MAEKLENKHEEQGPKVLEFLAYNKYSIEYKIQYIVELVKV